MEFDLQQHPRLAHGCKLREIPGQEVTLQIPEGQIKMSGAGLEIVKLCDGSRSIHEILGALKAKYPESFHERIEKETLRFLERLQERAVLSWA